MHTTHRWLSIFEGCLLVALGIKLLSSSQLLISGTAGLGLILLQVTSLSFGELFFLLNLPFYILALRYLGLAFTLRTFVSVSLLAALSELFDHLIVLNITVPFAAALLGGLLLGFGLIILFRHEASLGGFNILALSLEKRFNVHAGKTTLALDLIVLALGLYLLPGMQVVWSVAGFVALSSVMGRYHHPPVWARPYPEQLEPMPAKKLVG